MTRGLLIYGEEEAKQREPSCGKQKPESNPALVEF